jgi:hypothetical protein
MVYLSIVAFAIGRFGCGSTDTQLGHSRWHQFRWTSRSGNVASCVAARFSLGKSLLAETSRWPSRDAAYHLRSRPPAREPSGFPPSIIAGALRGGQILIGGSPFARTSTTFLQKLAGSRGTFPTHRPQRLSRRFSSRFFRVRGEIACELKPVPEGARRLSPLGSIEKLMFVRTARL